MTVSSMAQVQRRYQNRPYADQAHPMLSQVRIIALAIHNIHTQTTHIP